MTTTDIDDRDRAVEYRRGWHRRQDASASGGGYHVRAGGAGGGEPATVRLVFSGSEITYFYGVSSIGGHADVHIDGTPAGSVSQRGAGAGKDGRDPVFGQSARFRNLGGGTHELRIVHRSGAVYVDGFRVRTDSFCPADASAVQFTSATTEQSGTVGGASALVETVQVGAAGEEISVMVEGASGTVVARLLDSAGALAATGQSLIAGSGLIGFDATAIAPGIHTVQVVDPTAAPSAARLIVTRTRAR